MPIWLHHTPANGLGVYEATEPSTTILADPLTYTSVTKFHSNLNYPALLTQFDETVTLPAQSNDSAVHPAIEGTYLRDVITLRAHGQASPPIIKAMLVNFNGANRPLSGSFPVQNFGNCCRVIDVGVDGGNVVLVYRGYTQAQTGSQYASISLTVRVWIWSWVIDGSPDLYNAALPLLEVTPGNIQIGRGRFDTSRDYIRSATGSENMLLTRGETWTISGSNTNTTFPGWGWRYSVDGYTVEGQAAGSGTADFTRIQLP